MLIVGFFCLEFNSFGRSRSRSRRVEKNRNEGEKERVCAVVVVVVIVCLDYLSRIEVMKCDDCKRCWVGLNQ